MNSKEKSATRSSKLKVHRVNSQTISSYPVRFSPCLLFFFFSFFWFFLCLLSLLVFCFVFLIWNIIFRYVFDYATGWVIKTFSPDRFPETRLLFFGLTHMIQCFSDRFIISIAYLVELFNTFSVFFRIRNKSNKTWNSGNKSPERCSVASP